jgi:hypothetical protein
MKAYTENMSYPQIKKIFRHEMVHERRNKITIE